MLHECFPWQLLLGGTDEGFPHRALPLLFLLGGIATGSAHECLPRGPLLGRAKAVALTDVSQGGLSPEGSRRVSSTEELPCWLFGVNEGCLFTGPLSRSLSLKRLPCGGSLEPLFWDSLQERGNGDLLGGTTGASLPEISSSAGLLGASPSRTSLGGIFLGTGPSSRCVWEELGRHDQISEDLPGGM